MKKFHFLRWYANVAFHLQRPTTSFIARHLSFDLWLKRQGHVLSQELQPLRATQLLEPFEEAPPDQAGQRPHRSKNPRRVLPSAAARNET